MPKLTNISTAEQSELALAFAESIHAGFPSPAADHKGERINLAQEIILPTRNVVEPFFFADNKFVQMFLPTCSDFVYFCASIIH